MNSERTYIHIVRDAVHEVFRDARYVTFASITSIAVFVLAVLLPNLRLIAELMLDPNIPIGMKLKIPINFLGAISTNFSLFSASYTVAIALFFGINLAMIVYYIQKRKMVLQQSGLAASFGGVASGALGIGCAACGSFILSALGAAGAVALLPLKGAEFGILSVGLLAASIVSISKRINAPNICSLKS